MSRCARNWILQARVHPLRSRANIIEALTLFFLRVRRRRKSPGGHESRNDVKQSPDNTYSHARVT